MKKRNTRVYSLHGIRLAVILPDGKEWSAIEAILHYAGWQGPLPSEGADIVLRIVEHPEGVPRVRASLSPVEYDGIQFYRASDAVGIAWRSTRMYVDILRRRIDAYLPPEDWGSASRLLPEHLTVLLHGIEVLLRTLGWYPLQASAVARHGRVVLLCGPEVSGRKRLAYALARSGMALLAEDTVLLRMAGDMVMMYPVHRGSTDREERVAIRRMETAFHPKPGHLWKEGLSPCTWAGEVRPEVLIFPERVERENSQWRAIEADEALQRLIRQSRILALPPRLAVTHMDVLARLARQCRRYMLEVGRDLWQHPEAITNMLQPLFSPTNEGSHENLHAS